MGIGLALIVLLGLVAPARAFAQSTMSRSQTLGLLLLLGLAPWPPAAPSPGSKGLGAPRDKGPRGVAEQVTVNPALREHPPRAKPH
jgi:hypothetical protein